MAIKLGTQTAGIMLVTANGSLSPIALLDTNPIDPVSRLWSISYWPDNLVSAPTVTNATDNPATFTPPAAGEWYVVRLVRTLLVGTETLELPICIPDATGVYALPPPGVPADTDPVKTIVNLNDEAKIVGWAGAKRASLPGLAGAVRKALVDAAAAVSPASTLAPGTQSISHFKREQVAAVAVEEFGGVGDGVTNNHDAIIAAIASFNGNAGVVLFGAKVYATSPLITAAGTYAGFAFPGGINNVTLRGSGMAEVGNPNIAGSGTVLRAVGAQATVLQVSSRGVHVENMTLDGDHKVTDAVLALDYLNPQAAACSFQKLILTRAKVGAIQACTADHTTSRFRSVAHGFGVDDRVYFIDDSDYVGGSHLWGGWTQNTVWRIASVVDADHFTIKTEAGVAVTISSNGGAFSVRKYSGIALIRIGAHPSLEIDNIRFEHIYAIQNIADGKELSDCCVQLYGFNAFQIRFENCFFYNWIDGVHVQGAGAEFRTCEAFGVGGYSRAHFVRDGTTTEAGSWTAAPMLLDGYYVETDTLPLIQCINSPANSAIEPWVIANSDHNAERARIDWDCTQPLFVHKTKVGGSINLTATGLHFVSVDDCTLNNGVTAFGFSGDLQRLRRRNVYNLNGGAMLPDILGAGTFDLQICDGSQAALTRMNLTDGVASRLALIPANGSQPQRMLVNGGIYADHAGADKPDYGLVPTASVVEELFNAYLDSGGTPKYSRAGGAQLVQWDTTNGNVRIYTAPAGSADAAITFTLRLTLTQAGVLTLGVDAIGIKSELVGQVFVGSQTLASLQTLEVSCTVTGVAVSDIAHISVMPADATNPGATIDWGSPRISAANTVKFRISNSDVAPQNLAAVTWNVTVQREGAP